MLNDDGELALQINAVLDETGQINQALTPPPTTSFYMATPADSAATINAQLEIKRNVVLGPGVYHLENSIRPLINTTILGVGFPVLEPVYEGYYGYPLIDVFESMKDVTIAGVILQINNPT